MSERPAPTDHAALQERLPDLLIPQELDSAGQDLLRHLEGCEDCRLRLARLRRVHHLLADAGEAPEPSPGLSERIAAIPLRTQDAPSPRRRPGVFATGLAAAALAAGAILAFVALPGGDGPPRFEPPMTLDAAQSGIAVAVAMGSGSGGEMPMRITASGLTPGERYSLWLAGERGEVLVETFRPDGIGECHVVVTAPAGDWSRAIVRADDGPGDLVIASSTI